jgi:hypothetical protein
MIAASERSKVVNVDCVQCKTKYSLLVNPKDIISWQAGKYIQDAMPYLSSAERELLISQTCDTCWKHMYGVDNDEI